MAWRWALGLMMAWRCGQQSVMGCWLVGPSGLDMEYMLVRAYGLETACRLAAASVTACW